MMSKQYWHCDDCNGNFDHGEKCDCELKDLLDIRSPSTDWPLVEQNDPGPVFKVSECLVLGVDISEEEDVSCIQIARQRGSRPEIINTFYGRDAEKIYAILINGFEKYAKFISKDQLAE